MSQGVRTTSHLGDAELPPLRVDVWGTTPESETSTTNVVVVDGARCALTAAQREQALSDAHAFFPAT